MPTLRPALPCHALKGPDGHPGDVGERGLFGVDGEKV